LIRVCSWAISLPNSQGYQGELTDHTRAGGDQPPAFKQRITEVTAVLVLSRKKNEVLMIGDNVSITIVEIRGDKIKLGIVAPPDVTVDRLEVWKAKQLAEIIRELKDN
jgi:carbon storage regulator